jgi:hypothetical protein
MSTGIDTSIDTGDITADAAITKIGTEVCGTRVISGYLRHDEPGTVVLRQLYPGAPADIGTLDSIEEGTGQLVIYPAHRREWTDRDRLRLAEFFADRYLERNRDRCTATGANPGLLHEER